VCVCVCVCVCMAEPVLCVCVCVCVYVLCVYGWTCFVCVYVLCAVCLWLDLCVLVCMCVCMCVCACVCVHMLVRVRNFVNVCPLCTCVHWAVVFVCRNCQLKARLVFSSAYASRFIKPVASTRGWRGGAYDSKCISQLQ